MVQLFGNKEEKEWQTAIEEKGYIECKDSKKQRAFGDWSKKNRYSLSKTGSAAVNPKYFNPLELVGADGKQRFGFLVQFENAADQ